MSLRINSNIASIAAQRHLSKNQRVLEDQYQALASGSRLSTPQNDAAGFAISELLRGQIAGAGQAKNNTQMAIAFVQTAEGALNEQNNILVRLRELAINSASDTIGDKEREFVNQEFTMLVAEFDRIAKVTRFGSRELLTGSGEEFSFQVGAYNGEDHVIGFTLEADTTADSVGIADLEVLEQEDARDALDSIDEAVMKIAESRAYLGAVQSRFQIASDHLDVQGQNLEEARSLIADVDVAQATSKLASAQVLQEAGLSVLVQANSAPSRLLRLIG